MTGLPDWPEELQFEQIRAVPSYHWWPEFAIQVRREVEKFKPDIIAIELPDIYQQNFCRAVSFLPALSAVITSYDEFIPVYPEDSIVEAARLAAEKGIELASVDLEIKSEENQDTDYRFLADSALLEQLSLTDFYLLNASKFPSETSDESFCKREEHMASRLQELAATGRKILFVCGMAHWQRIRERLHQVNRQFRHRSCIDGREGAFSAIAGVPIAALVEMTKAIPFRASIYEETRKNNAFSLHSWLNRLYTDAAGESEIHLKPGDLHDMLKYLRNQAVLEGRLSPTPGNLALSASGIISPDFARVVYEKCFTYAYSQYRAPVSLQVVYNDGCYLETPQRLLPLQPYYPAEYPFYQDFAIIHEDKRISGRQSPHAETIKKNPYKPLSDYWGRYADEMDEEERFISTLERWAYHAGTGDETVSCEFADGLIDGIDIGETVRDLVNGRLYVREFISEEPRFSAVLVEFNDDFNNFGEAIYTYGRHKALAFTSPDEPNPDHPGTASREFSLMLSFKRLIDNQRLWAMYDEMLGLVGRQRLNPREAIMRMALASCRVEDLLVVAPKSSLAEYRKLAGKIDPSGGANFSALRREDIWNPACDKIRRFNVYYYL